jgi:competence protein ComEA
LTGRASFLGGLGTGIVLTIATILLYQLFATPAAAVRVSAPPRPTAAPIMVQAAGAVQNPGLYNLPATARIDDVVKAAGGLSEQADGDLLNLAARVTDGQRVVIPRKGATGAPAPVSAGGSLAAPTAVGRISLNRGSMADLESLPGIGPATAQRIVEQRQRSAFTSVEELLELKIVNSGTFARIKDLVGVE